MATIGIVNATNLRVYVVTSAGEPPKLEPIASQLNGTLTVSHNLNTSVNKDDGGWEKSRPGARNWSISGDCEFEFDADYGEADLQAFIQSRQPLAVRFSTEQESDYHYRGYAYLESLELTGDAETNLTYSFSLKGTGLLTREVIAKAGAAGESNLSDDSVTLNGVVNPMDKACTVQFEYSDDDSFDNSVAADQSPLAAGTSPVMVTADLTGLSPSTKYYWRIKVTNAIGIVYSDVLSFTTSE